MLNNIIFIKNKFHNNIKCIINDLSEYYLPSKQKYIENGETYKGFITIIRQLCKLWDIEYTSKIKYNKNDYNIEYYFYI